LDWKRKPPAVAVWKLYGAGILLSGPTELADVHLSGESQAQRPHAQPARDHYVWSCFGSVFMRSIVQNAPFLREPIFLPLLFDMDERPLSLAEQEMLQP